MAIRVGRPSPELTAEAYVRGEDQLQSLSLGALQGQSVVLFFYPRDCTFDCPTELQAYPFR